MVCISLYVIYFARYEAVIDACGMRPDLESFEQGDRTVVSGTSLSGGQRQRLALARAAYSPAKVLFLVNEVNCLRYTNEMHVFTLFIIP